MAFELRLKEKHYKKSRFGNKSEKEISEFKKDKITQDLEDIQRVGIENINIQFQLINNLKFKINIPESDNSLNHIITQKQLNAFSLILSVIEQKKEIDFLQLMSYTFDEKTVHSLYHLLNEGKIKKMQILMTETASFRIPKIYKLLKDLFSNNEKVNLCFYWVHSKIHLLKCKNEYYVIDGSGNFSMNAQVEHYNFFKSKDIYNFHYELSKNFFFGVKLRKNHEIYKNFKT